MGWLFVFVVFGIELDCFSSFSESVASCNSECKIHSFPFELYTLCRTACCYCLVLALFWRIRMVLPSNCSCERLCDTVAQCGVPAHATKAHVGRKIIAPLILILGCTWNWVVNFKPLSLHSRNCGIYWKRGWVGPRVYVNFQKKIILNPHRDSNPTSTTLSLVAVPDAATPASMFCAIGTQFHM